eukprot:1141422-Pelagomonas_calceolata.AAC.1
MLLCEAAALLFWHFCLSSERQPCACGGTKDTFPFEAWEGSALLGTAWAALVALMGTAWAALMGTDGHCMGCLDGH